MIPMGREERDGLGPNFVPPQCPSAVPSPYRLGGARRGEVWVAICEIFPKFKDEGGRAAGGDGGC